MSKRLFALCIAAAMVGIAVPASAQTTLLFVDSQPGDIVGGGMIQTLTPPADTFAVGRNFRNGVSFAIHGTDFWFLDLAASLNTLLVPGTYGAATAFESTSLNGLRVNVSGRRCPTLTGRFVVLEAEYAPDGTVVRFAADLEQHCDDATPALFGALRYNSTITTTVPFSGDYPRYQLSISPPSHGVVTGDGIACGHSLSSCASTLPAAASVALNATPDPGYIFTGWTGACHGLGATTINVNSVRECSATFDTEVPVAPRTLMFWDSEPGDPIGLGVDELYSAANSVWTVSAATDGSRVALRIGGLGPAWTIEIGAPAGETLSPGTYPQVLRSAFRNVGSLAVSTDGRLCAVVTGRVSVLEIALAEDGSVLRFAADIEQHCNDAAAALVASIRYNSMVAEVRPFGGNYPRYELTLDAPAHGSVVGPDVMCGGEQSICQVAFDSARVTTLTAVADAGYLFTGWTGACTGGTTTTIQVNTVKSCAATFEPVAPATPRTVLVIDSQTGDAAGMGKQRVYASENASFRITRNERNGIHVVTSAPEEGWSIDFSAPLNAPLSVGTYAPVTRYGYTPFAGMSVTRVFDFTCNQLTGRFVVLEVAYAPDGTVERFAVDFEQHCNDMVDGLFGSVRYNSTLPATPFGGDYPRYGLSIVTPVHGTVTGEGIECGGTSTACDITLEQWSTAYPLTATPDPGYIFTGWTGGCNGGSTITVNLNMQKTCGATFDLPIANAPRALLLLESELGGEPVGKGELQVFSSANSIWTAALTSDLEGVDVTIDSVGDLGLSRWVLRFRAPRGSPLQPGVYTPAESATTHTTDAGLDVSADGRSCKVIVGSFTVQELVYDPATRQIMALAVDFEQRCNSMSWPPLIGTLRVNSTVGLPVRDVTLFAHHVFPARFNQIVEWTATAHPALPVEYSFWRQDPSSGWTEVQPYGPNSTYRWIPGYADIGIHSLEVRTRAIGSTADYEAKGSTTFAIDAGEPLRFEAFTASSPSPILAGSPITWTAKAAGGQPPLQYQFWRLDADTWHLVQSYSASGVYTWTPNAGDVGPHAIQVWVRSSDTPAPYELYTGSTFEVGAPEPIAVTSLTTTSALPALVGQAIVWRATAGGGVSPLQYQFWRLDAAVWRMVQDYGPSSTYSWTPGGADIGQHALQVWVRSFGSNQPYDAWAGAAFSVAAPNPATLTSLSRFPSSTPPAGMEVQWTAIATGGLAPLQFQYWRLDGGSWTMVRDWGPSNTLTWRTGLADIGEHALQVWVHSAGSSATYESWLGESFTIGPPVIEINYFSYYPSLHVGTPITWTVVAFGGVAPLQYQFWRLDPDGWHMVQDYGPSQMYTWTPTLADVGPHSIQVWIRNAGSTAPYDVWRDTSFVIIDP